jgi:hypothetical protein
MYRDRLEENVRNWYYKKPINEATDSSGSGSYKVPMTPGTRLWNKNILEPFTIQVSKYDDAMLAYDSYDGKMSSSKKQINKIEKKAKSIELNLKNNPVQNDDDGDNLNQTPGKNLTYVPIVNEWVEITKDTVIGDLNKKQIQTESLNTIIKKVLRGFKR